MFHRCVDLFQLVDHFDDSASIFIHISFSLEQHFYQLNIVLFVHSNIFGHLWIESVKFTNGLTMIQNEF